MTRSGHPTDTDPESYAVLVGTWQKMSVGERAELVQQLCHDVEVLARADIFGRHPTYTDIEVSRELARRRYGATFADAAYAGLLPD